MLVQYSRPDGTVVLGATSYIGFFGSTPGSSIVLNTYQSSTYQTSSLGTLQGGVLPNVKYVSATQCDFGSGTKLLTQIPFGACTLRIRLSSGSLSKVRLQAVHLVAHSGSNVAVGPVGMIVHGFEKSNSTWTTMSGSAAPLVLTPHVTSGSYIHDYFVCLSATPTIAKLNNTVSLSLYTEWY